MLLAVTLSMILIPASILVVLFALPTIRTLMVDVVEGWGAAIGLGGLAADIAEAMPVIVLLACIATMMAGIIGLTKGRTR